MPAVDLFLNENVSSKAGKAAAGFGNFVVAMNQGLDLLERVGGRAYAALDATFETAGRSESVTNALRNLAGGADEAQGYLLAVKAATHETVSGLDAMQIATIALNSKVVTSADQMHELAEIATVTGRALGRQAGESVERLTLAIAKLEPELLDELGINIKRSDLYRQLAADLHVNQAALTDVQKRQAFANEVFRQGRERVEELGGFVESSATKWSVLKTRTDDLRVAMTKVTADALEPMLDKLLELSDVEPAFLAQGAGEAFDTLRESLGLLSDDGFNPVLTANSKWEAGLLGLLNPLDAVTGLVGSLSEAAGENAKAAQANAQADKMQAEFISQVSDALGVEIASFERAVELKNENREVVRKHVEALRAQSAATEEAAKVTAGLVSTQDMLASIEDEVSAALKAVGFAIEDTVEGQKDAEAEWRRSYKLIEESGRLTAAQLTDIWEEHYSAVQAGAAETTIQVIGENTAQIDQLTAAFGSGLFTGEDVEIATWIDTTREELLARQEEIMGPIEDAVTGGLEAGFEEVDVDSLGERVGESVRLSLLDVAGDQELVGALAEAFGIFTGQSIGDTGDFSRGKSREDLSTRDQAKVEDLIDESAFDALVAQGLQGALRAIEEGDFLALKRIHDGARSNAANARRYGNGVHSREFIESNLRLADVVKSLARIFNLDIPGFKKGGIGDFGAGTLAMLHDREAILPLGEGGAEIRDAVLGRDSVQAIGDTAAGTAATVDRLEQVLFVLQRIAAGTAATAQALSRRVGAVELEVQRDAQRGRAVSSDGAAALRAGTASEVVRS